MCFSPTASFTTAALTGVIGLVSLSRVTRPSELPLAATPLIFGIQQAVEGGLWLTLPTAPNGTMTAALALAFLLVAQVFWPIYSPLAALSLEHDTRRRKVMLVCLVAGTGVAAYLLWGLVTGPRDAAIVNRCIVYHTHSGDPLVVGLAYMAAVCLPMVLSTKRVIVLLGAIVMTGSVVAYIFFWQAFQSVWCYFAAAASLVIFGHFESSRRSRPMTAAAVRID